MEKNQSAVKWLEEEFDKIEKDWEKDSIEYSDLRNRAVELAEYKFKEQINEAYNQGQMDGFGLEEKDNYYNETFKSK